MSMMKFIALLSLSTLVAAGSPLHGVDPPTTYDPIYDEKTAETSTLDCSGTILAKNPAWTEFSKIPNFPNIAGGAAVTEYDSPECGTCWALTYQDITINVLLVDYAKTGFNIAESTMNTLTDGQAVNVGVINTTATQVAASKCGW